MTLASDTLTLSPTAIPETNLRAGSLTPLENLSQSIANIAPTMTPALNVTVVAGLSGGGSWVAYLIATIAMLVVAVNINSLARRHALSGSFFIYISRTLGPFAGIMAGWSMIAAYLLTAVSVILAIGIFLGNVLTQFGVPSLAPPAWILAIVFVALAAFAAYRDVKLSSRLGLVLEGFSIAVIIGVIAAVTIKRGTIVDHTQMGSNIHFGSVMAGLTFAVFSFVGFESSATLAKETANANVVVPRSILYSTAITGIFFVVMCYFMILAVDGNADLIGKSSSPMADVTGHAGMSWAATLIYCAAMVSAFACALASINAASRLVFSMGRFKFFGSSMGKVHVSHQTPHLAVGICGILCLLATIALLPFGVLNAFGYAGTVATFGFIVVYLLVCIVAPMDLARTGDLKAKNVIASVVGVAMMLFVIGGSVYPVPDYPMNLLPYAFLVYMVLGALWFLYLKRKAPEALASIEHDLEG